MKSMIFTDEKAIAKLRSTYPSGTKIILSCISDPYTKLKAGSKGTVQFIDDAGQIHVLWECGLELALIEGTDRFSILQPDF